MRLSGVLAPPVIVVLAPSIRGPGIRSVVDMANAVQMPPSTTTDDHALVPVERPTGLRRVMLDTAYNLSAFMISLAAFIVVVTGISLGAGLLVLIIGPLVLAATIYVARGFAILERRRLRTFQGRQAPTPVYVRAREGDGAWRRMLTPFRDPQSLLDVAWSLLGLVTGTLAACISITWWAAAGGGLTYWFWERFIPFGEDNTTLAELLGLGDGRTPEIWLNLGIGIFALLTLPLANRLAAVCHANFAWLLLTNHAGPRP